MADRSPSSIAKQLCAILDNDMERLLRIDRYLHGKHDDPYMPVNADDEYRLIVKRAVSNWMPLLVGTPAQAMYVDTFRRGGAGSRKPSATATAIAAQQAPEMAHWERSRLGARQLAIHRGALAYGHSFTLTEKVGGEVHTKGLSPLRTSALFEDAANDETPYAVLTVTAWPSDDGKTKGVARMWIKTKEFTVRFGSLSDDKSISVSGGKLHGASECPVTRFAASVDLDGRTVGVIEPMIALQDRINQTVFDLMIAQTFASTMVRTATGMAPPMKRDADGEIILDEDGQPIPMELNVNAKRFLFAEDPDVKFGSLDATPLSGFIESLDMSIRHLAAISQTPPHHLLGQIANLSAEALQAAETALTRKIQEFQATFGESWERVFRLAAELSGDLATADDFSGEVIWRDMESKSIAQAADALGKMREQIGIPAKGLWKRVPGVTQQELDEWERLAKDEDKAGQMAESIQRAAAVRKGALVTNTNNGGSRAAAPAA